MSERGPIRLAAADAEDLAVIAACLQDAVVPMREMAFEAAAQRFVMVASRFRWETDADAPVAAEGRIFERVHCGVCFDGVRAVKTQGIDRKRRGQILSLLTIVPEAGHIDLIFSAGGVLRLECDAISCRIEDLDEPWPTPWRPHHPDTLDAPAGAPRGEE